MEKKVLSEKAIYTDEIKLPKGFEINPLELSQNILKGFYLNKNLIQSKHFDQLIRYVIENFELKQKIKLVDRKTWGNIFTPNEEYNCLSSVDPNNLNNSPDFTCLYGINTEDCYVTIYYDDNKRKGKNYKIQLKHNCFIMFPSTITYTISNNQKSNLNFIQTITFDYF